MDSPDGSPVLRIGELSRRLGVSDHVLRAWESRYGLLQPVRSAGGFRLYSEADALRVRRMQAHLARGLSAAEAARAVLGEDNGAGHGRALMETFYAAAAQAGAPGVHVTVTTANTRALGFYHRLGFRRLEIARPGETTVTYLGRAL